MKSWLGLAALATFAANPFQDNGVDLDLKNKENVVASRLEGTWKPHEKLWERLTDLKPSPKDELSFTFDRAAIPDDVLKKLGKVKTKLTIYAIGKLEISGEEHPFFLTSLNGNPCVLYYRERNGDAFGDMESFNLILAPGKSKETDLLFKGGDFNNQPFYAYERVK